MSAKIIIFHWRLMKITAWLALVLGLAMAESGRAQAVVAYQGQINVNGKPFMGTGQFQFALVTSTNVSVQATATASLPSGGYITSYQVVSGGLFYTTTPKVQLIGGGGTGAMAVAHVTQGGVIGAITVGNPGNGDYTSAPTVVIDPPPANLSYTTYWSNDGTSVAGSEPTAMVPVAVSGGVFNVGLGDTNLPGMTLIPIAIFQQANLQVRIWFNDGTNGFAALDPAQNFTTVPYAATAQNLANVVQLNTIYPFQNASVGGGIGNAAGDSSFPDGIAATVSGGESNSAVEFCATVGGGYNNQAISVADTVGGGKIIPRTGLTRRFRVAIKINAWEGMRRFPAAIIMRRGVIIVLRRGSMRSHIMTGRLCGRIPSAGRSVRQLPISFACGQMAGCCWRRIFRSPAVRRIITFK